jgi:hypothetical protein
VEYVEIVLANLITARKLKALPMFTKSTTLANLPPILHVDLNETEEPNVATSITVKFDPVLAKERSETRLPQFTKPRMEVGS